MTVLIRNTTDDYDSINSVVTEPVYQEDTTSVHNFTVIAGDTGMTGVTFTPHAFDPSDIEPTFTPASADSYQYITLSNDNNNFYSTLTENFTPLEEKVLYLKATIPSDAEIGTWKCGLDECYDSGTGFTPITGFEDWKHYAILPVTGGIDVMDWIVDLTLDYIEGAMSYYFYDVRFALSDGTELDYERVSVTEGDNAVYRILLEDVPISPTVTNIYVLFGNDEIYEEDEDTDLGDNPEGAIYRKNIELTGSTDGAKTDFQRKLIVDHVSGKMRSDFGDVRFYESDGETEIPYDLATYIESDTAVFILFFDSIPASPDTISIYMQYGSGETTTSDPANVYDVYISGDTDESAEFTLIDIYNSGVNGSLSYDSVNKYYIVYPTGDDEVFTKIDDLDSTIDLILKADIYRATNTANQQGGLIGRKNAQNTYIKGRYITTSANRLDITQRLSGTDTVKDQDSYKLSQSTWYTVELIIVGTTVTLNWYNSLGTLVNSESGTIDSSINSGDWGLFTGYHANSQSYFKNIMASKTTANPPTWGSWGEEEGIGLPSTGSLGSTQLNGHLYEKDLTIWGKVLSQTPEAPIGNEELVVINVSGNTNIGGMTDFNITKRANDKATGFQFNYRTGTDGVFDSGDTIILTVNGNGYNKKYLTGMIYEVEHNLIPANRTYSLSGKDRAAQLSEQSYFMDGFVIGTGTTGSILMTAPSSEDIIYSILYGTNIRKGPCAIDNLEFVNHCHEWTVPTGAWFFGYFKTKKIAIDFLCSQASKQTGKTYLWFVDNDGVLNIYDFEDKSTQSYISINKNNPRLVSVNFKDSITSIVNKQTGYYGENEEDSVTITDSDSISRYRIHECDDLHDSSMTYNEMRKELQSTIDRLAWPIYTVEFTLKRFVDVDIGQPLYTDIEPGGGVLFIVSDVSISGSPAKDMTIISATTDPSVFSEEEEVEIIKTVALDAINDNNAVVGTVSSVLNDGTVGVTTWGTGGSLSAKDINAN